MFAEGEPGRFIYTTITTITITIVCSVHPLPEHNFEVKAFKLSLRRSVVVGVTSFPFLHLRVPWQS